MKKQVQKLLDLADVKINGSRPWDIQVYNEDFYKRVLSGGSLALGESYMDGWWDCKQLDEFFNKVLTAELDKKVISKKFILKILQAKLFNLQTKSKSKIVGEKHYDVGNDLYKLMLDKRMNYSCAYWPGAKTLDQAQEQKLDLICKKMKLKEGMKIADIGCGWGAFVKYAAEKYKVKSVGVTISKEQAKLAKESCRDLPVEIKLMDYRDLTGEFDAIISIGMFEHVGYKNYREYMKKIYDLLPEGGYFLLHTIGSPTSSNIGEVFLDKYIFPHGMLPSIKQIAEASEGLFIIEDLHNLGVNYDKTLMEWIKNFNKNWNKIKDKYDQRFFRMWNYYLASVTGSFRSRDSQLWQIVLTKGRLKEGYERP